MARRARGEGSITRRTDGRWQASIQLDGRRRSVYGKTRAEAVAKLDALRKQVARAGLLPDPHAHTVADLMAAWLDVKANTLKPRTLSDHRATIDRYIIPTLGKRTLDKVTPARLTALYAQWQRQGKHRTALRIHRALYQALALATRWGWLARNPAELVDAPRYTPKRKDVWTAQELAVFLDGTRDHWLYPCWLTLIATGARLGEILALEWDDVDLDAGVLAITKSAQVIDGERITTTPKTASGNRTITLPADVVAMLRMVRANQAAQRLAMGKDWHGGALVFTKPTGKPLTASAVQQALPRECDRLRIPRQTPHQLRHLHASLLIAAGLAVTDVSRRLGHSNPAITLRVYSHALGKSDQAATAAIADALAMGDRR